jgi:hypothetical protein
MKKGLFVLLTTVWAAVSVFAQTGVISSLAGSVELKPAGAANFTPAREGDEVGANTVIFTGFKSSATVTVGSSTILVRPLTRLTLTEISATQDTERVNIDLKAGRVRVDVRPPSGAKADFTVVTPSATASVRGTGFDLDTRNLSVNEGTVVYQGVRGAAALVYPGAAVHADTATGKVADPVAAVTSELVPPTPTAGPPGGSTAGSTQAGEREIGNFSIGLDLQF